MKQIAQFFTLFWIIYFPTCIAYNDLPGFSSVDELMTVILIGFTLLKRHHWSVNRAPFQEFKQFLGIYVFYILYSIAMAVNTRQAVFLDMVQWIRPFSVIYCTWILNPRFSNKQKKWMLRTMVLTLLSWIAYHPESVADEDAEFPVLGQLAICCGMSWYLFTEETSRNRRIAIVLVFLGMLAPKFKFLGEAVCFVAVLYFLKSKLNFKSSKTIVYVLLLMAAVLGVTWTRFDAYYFSGISSDSEQARSRLYNTMPSVLIDYFPFGPGLGTYGTAGSGKEYSQLYYKYNLNEIWGLTPADSNSGFFGDAFYPALAEFGVVGIFLFLVFWKRIFLLMKDIEDLKYYRVTMMAFLCLAIEQTADSSFLSGKGMGYCMLIGLGMNANRNLLSVKNHDEGYDESSNIISYSNISSVELDHKRV